MNEVQKRKIERELSDLLSAYLRGDKALSDCAEWLSSVNWEEIDVASSLANELGELDLLCTEAREGLRPESDFERKASDLVATSSCIIYSIARPQILVSSSSTNAGVESPVLLFWNRLLQETPASPVGLPQEHGTSIFLAPPELNPS